MCFMLVNYNYIYIYILIHIYWYYIGYISITESVLWLFIWRWNFAQATTRPMCDRWSKPRWIDVEGICFFVKTSVSGWWKRVVSMSNMYIYILYIYTLESYILSLYVYVYIYIHAAYSQRMQEQNECLLDILPISLSLPMRQPSSIHGNF